MRPHGAPVVEREYGGRPRVGVQYGRGRAAAGLLGVAALDQLDLIGQPVIAHRAPVATAPQVGDRARPAVDVGDTAVAEAGEVLDGLRHALVVGRPNHIDIVGCDRPSDHHHRELAAQSGQPLDRCFRTEQDQRLAAGVEQRLDGPRLVAAARDRAQHEVVAVPIGSVVDVLDELRVEGVVDVHHDADETAASAGQRAGRPIWAVAEALGRGQHALPGGRARSGDAAKHEGDRRR